MWKTKHIYILIFCSISFFSCSTTNEQANENKLEKFESNNELKKKINELNNQFYNQNRKVDSLLSEINFLNSSQYQLLVKLNNRMNEFDQIILNHDSLYTSIIENLSSLENNIVVLGQSYNEIAQIKTKEKIEEIPVINNAEYKEKYIQSLEAYQNGNWEIGINGFTYLLMLDQQNELADNCQYWIGEIFYKTKQYHKAIIEFNLVANKFPDSDKIDDSMYQLANCYLKLGNRKTADEYLFLLIENYQNSEYVKKANYLLEK